MKDSTTYDFAEEERKIKESSPSYEETARQGNERDLPILKEPEPYIGSFKDKMTDCRDWARRSSVSRST